MNVNNPHQTNFSVPPYLQLIKPEMLDRINGIPDVQKPKINGLVTNSWAILQGKHPSTPEHAAAIKQLQQVGAHIRNIVKENQAKQMAATQAQAQNGGGQSASQMTAQASQQAVQARMQQQLQQQQQGQQGVQQNQQQGQTNAQAQAQLQAHQARMQAQAQIQAQAAQAQAQAQNQGGQGGSSQQAGPSQGGQNPPQAGQQAGGQAAPRPPTQTIQASPAIRSHVEAFVFTYPPSHPEGTPEGAKWLEATKHQYTQLLACLERANQIRVAKNDTLTKVKAANQQIPQTLAMEVQAATQQWQKFKNQLETFRANQSKLREKLMEQRKAQEAKKEGTAAGTNAHNGNSATSGAPSALGAASTASAAQPQQPSQQGQGQGQGQGNNNTANTTTAINTSNMATFPQKPFNLQQPPQRDNANSAARSNSGNMAMASNPGINTAKANNNQGSGTAASPTQAQTPTNGQPTNNQGQFARPPQGFAQNPVRPPLNPQSGPQGADGQAPNPSLSHGDALHAARSHSEHRPTTSSTPNNPNQTTPHNPSSLSQAHQKFPISKVLPQSVMNQPQPVVTGPSRPTMANGGASSQPIIAKQPAFTLEGEGSSHVLSKKKLNELVRQVTGGAETVTPEVEEIVMEVADEFIDSLITAACRLAKLRPDATLEIRDIQTVLERNYNIRIPGYSLDETRVTRRVNPSPAWSQKIGAINTAKVMGNTKPDA